MSKGYCGVFVPNECPFERPASAALTSIVHRIDKKNTQYKRKKIKAVPETNLADMILSQGMIWDYTAERQKEESGSQSILWDTIENKLSIFVPKGL